jgi:DNA replication protein DnaC
MAAKTINYFVNGNTAQGFIDYFSSNLQGMNRIFILKGGPGTGKSFLIKSIADDCEKKNVNTELIHSPFDPDTLDGIIIPELKIAVVDGSAPHVIEPTAPGAVEEYVNHGSAWNSIQLISHKDEIMDINKRINECCENAYKRFADAIEIHNEWEKIYIKNMDFAKANKLSEETIKTIIGDKSADKASVVKHRFFGASSPSGPVNYIDNITENVSKRYLLKGRPGTGKSTLLKKLAEKASERGFDVDVYHCAFDAASLDMVLIPELDVCVFDSTPPHKFEPSRPNDEIIDMYSRCVKRGTDEKYEREIQGISARYSMAVHHGTKYLADAQVLHNELKKFYIDAMDFEKINALGMEIKKEIQTAYDSIKQ